MSRRRQIPIAIPLPPDGVEADDLIVTLQAMSASYELVRVTLERGTDGQVADVPHLIMTAGRRRAEPAQLTLEPMPLDPESALDRRVMQLDRTHGNAVASDGVAAAGAR